MQEIGVNKRSEGQNLYRFICKILPKAPDSFVQKLFRKKEIRVNGIKEDKNYIIKEADVIRIYLKDELFDEFSNDKHMDKHDIDLPIIFENEDILILNKPKGILTQACGSREVCVNDFLYKYVGVDRGFSPSTCNRLDRNTSGIVCAGKTIKGLQELSYIFREKKVRKFYKTIVCKRLEKEIHDVAYIKRRNNKSYIDKDGERIETKVTPIKHYGEYTLCNVELFTGKTHQIRAHLSKLGYSILGDAKYGKATKELEHYLLHCFELDFDSSCKLGLNGKRVFAELPVEFEKIIRRLENDDLVY